MSGYSANAHISGAAVRPARARPLDPPGVEAPPPAVEGPLDAPRADIGRFERLMADVRTAWTQTTFYLFDPESWR